MRYLAIDLGDKRTGLAVGDRETEIVTPLDVVEVPLQGSDAGARLIEAIARTSTEFGAEALVIGLPLNMDGTEGPRAKTVRQFASRMSESTGLPVEFHDERLTSSAADWQMSQSGLTHKQKKKRRDALAAAAILRDFLAQRTE